MDSEERIRRGQQAERLLNDALLREAFDTIRAKTMKELLESRPGDRDKREWLYQLHKSVDAVESLLTVVVNGGKIEAHNLELPNSPDAE